MKRKGVPVYGPISGKRVGTRYVSPKTANEFLSKVLSGTEVSPIQAKRLESAGVKIGNIK